MKNYFWIALVLCTHMLCAPEAVAEMSIRVTEGRVAPMPIAVTDLFGEDARLADLGRQISDIVRNDLESCGLFQPLDQAGFIQTPLQLRDGPRFADWRLINAQTLVKGEVTALGDGRMRAEFRLYDVLAETQMEGLAFFATPQDMRRMAHKIADAIYKRVTGDEGYFDTKIAYVSQTGPSTKRTKRLAIMDQDGANHRFLSTGQSLVLTPRFSPNGQEITYLDFLNNRQARVSLMRLATGQKQLLGNFKGMTFAPRFSPNGNEVMMSFAAGGRTSLYKMNLSNRSVQRLTDGPVIDTSPSYSPDGSQVAFTSDRGGTPQIYVMSSNGGEPRRITFGSNDARYYTPVWSPRGDLIAFTKSYKGSFYIGVMKTDGSGERLLSSGYVVEDPSWSPNGRVIMFSRMDRGGGSGIYRIDLTGYHEKKVKTPTEAAGGSWSPLIP